MFTSNLAITFGVQFTLFSISSEAFSKPVHSTHGLTPLSRSSECALVTNIQSPKKIHSLIHKSYLPESEIQHMEHKSLEKYVDNEETRVSNVPKLLFKNWIKKSDEGELDEYLKFLYHRYSRLHSEETSREKAFSVLGVDELAKQRLLKKRPVVAHLVSNFVTVIFDTLTLSIKKSNWFIFFNSCLFLSLA